jgi:hypothetical protein
VSSLRDGRQANRTLKNKVTVTFKNRMPMEKTKEADKRKVEKQPVLFPDRIDFKEVPYIITINQIIKT